MTSLKIATWNINSVRLRQDLVCKLALEEQPDLICLQETKTINDTFPSKTFEELGYTHHHISGIKSYNGVAILSKLPLFDLQIHERCERKDARHISALVEKANKKIEVHCLYVPSGGDIPDPKENEKFDHKLNFLDEITNFFSKNKPANLDHILVGDFNIAPHEHDVWSHKQLINVVSHTSIEVEKLLAWQKINDYVDVARHFIPMSQKSYSWWSYRSPNWDSSDRGRRLDHIWVSQGLKDHLSSYKMIRAARGWEPKPSDHVPVLAQLTF